VGILAEEAWQYRSTQGQEKEEVSGIRDEIRKKRSPDWEGVFCLVGRTKRKKSFLVQQFLENAAEVKGEQPLSPSADGETPQ
jgi:asparagine synthetase B (glutamine-hydrolysing)